MILLAIALILASDFSSNYWTEGTGGRRYADWIKIMPKQKPMFRIGLWTETGKFFVLRWEGDSTNPFHYHQEGAAAVGIKFGFDF